jgi:hypothetical protein
MRTDACGGKQKTQIPAIAFCIFNSRIHNGSKDERPATQKRGRAQTPVRHQLFLFAFSAPALGGAPCKKRKKVMRVVVTFHYVRMYAAG